LAEAVGFEPTVGFPLRSVSNRVLSASQPRFRLPSFSHPCAREQEGKGEPPRFYRRVICSTTRRPYRVCSGLHRTPSLLLRVGRSLARIGEFARRGPASRCYSLFQILQNRIYPSTLVATRCKLNVTTRCPFQLRKSFVIGLESSFEADDEICGARESAPEDNCSRWRVLSSGKVAAEAGDGRQVEIEITGLAWL
jgi:hypothetical protein